jgi:diguanylate cyclase (GGDEF)-like protein/PAS domain S-box-containing protein
MNPRLASLLEKNATAWTVLVASIVMTVLAWFASYQYIQHDAEERFKAAVELARYGIRERIAAYQEVLRAGAGLISGSEQVTKAEWKIFVDALQIDRIYPGIQGLGYAVRVPPEGKAALERGIRADGFPGFAVWPSGLHEAYSAVIYLEPFDWRNQRAFGYDMFSEPIRREAMERARDTGQIAMSGRVTLVQEIEQDVQSGTLLYLPVYRARMPLTTVAEREAALLGYVFCGFRIADLMRGILGPGNDLLDFSLYDGGTVNEKALMYRSTQSGGDDASAASGDRSRASRRARYSSAVALDVGGRTWTAHFTSSPRFEASVSSLQPALIGAGGVIADLLLFITLLAVSNNSRLIARERNRFRMAVEAAPVAMVVVNEDGTIDLVNGTFEKLFGYERNELVGCKVEALLPVDMQDRHVALREAYMVNPVVRQMGMSGDLYGVRKDGSQVAIEIGLSPSQTESGHFVIAAVSDVTERKRLEAERAKAEELIRHLAFHDPLTQLPNRRLLADRLKLAIAATRRNGGHGALLFVDLDRFKQINDQFGHETGDQLLVQVAQRLSNCVREEDTVARFGGDEFVIMLAGLPEDAGESIAIARLVGDKILESMGQPYRLNKHAYGMTASIGATLFQGDDDVDAIFRRADAAMYRVKASGRNALIFFDSDLPSRAKAGS